MEQVIHADIFFFVTTVVIAVLGIMGLVASIFLIIAAKNIKDLSKTLKDGGEKLVADVTEESGALRKNVRKYGKDAMKIGSYLLGSYLKKRRSTKKDHTSRNDE